MKQVQDIYISLKMPTPEFIVDGSITSESEGSFNHDNDATVEFNATSSDLLVILDPVHH